MESCAAIDFETAASDRNSACAVGAVVFENGAPAKRFRLLSDRQQVFSARTDGAGHIAGLIAWRYAKR